MATPNVYNNLRPITVQSAGDVTQQPLLNSTVTTTFPVVQAVQRCRLALSNINVYYSWFNITADYGNNQFSYIWPNGAGSTTYTVTVPDGNYSLNDLSSYLQYAMTLNGTYLIDASGTNQYYISWVSNPTYYRVTMTVTPVPAAGTLPAGWTQPANYPGTLPTTSRSPQIVVPAAIPNKRSSFGYVMGFPPGTYPATPATAVTSFNGQYVPEIDVVQSVNVQCSMVNQGLVSRTPNTIYTFTVNAQQFGGLISITPPQFIWFPVNDGNYASITLSLTDQNNYPLPLSDPFWGATVLLEEKV